MNITIGKLKSIITEEVSEMRTRFLPENEGAKQTPSQMLDTLDDIGGLVKWVGDNMGEPEYGDPLEAEERLERLDQLITVLYDSISDLLTSDKDGYSKVGGTRPMQEGDLPKIKDRLKSYRGSDETGGNPIEGPLKLDPSKMFGAPKSDKDEPSKEVHDAWVDIGKFLAKLYNQGQDELAADLDKILVKFQAAGAIPRKAGIEEADEGGPGVHDIFNLPEPEAVEPSGNPKEDAIRQIVASSSMAKVDGQRLDLFTAGAIVSVLDALGPENKAHYLRMPVAKMADMAFKLIK